MEMNTTTTLNSEGDHCPICLQSFLDKTIVPVCAHEFCFECIVLWADQSRKCPLCSRSFENAYLIHRIRSQNDYEKYYLLPLRSSPPPSTTESRTNTLRNTRRERQWGRRQRQQREEEDQLERAIARRRWIYQHHLYAKHIASNAYTRYRPFPTPAQFAASPDLITRMTIFLRRELRVWPNLDVEFLTTYTISLMKSIDIRSESAVKLLSEFLDLDGPYMPGARHVNAEHLTHEIYSYLRSPYRDLNTYDQTAQYDTPQEVSPPQEIERGSRWSTEYSPSRRSLSRSGSRQCRNDRRGRDRSTEARSGDGPSRKRTPRSNPLGQDGDVGLCNHRCGTRHSPADGDRDISRHASRPSGIENQYDSQGNQKGKSQATNTTVPIITPKTSIAPLRGDDTFPVVDETRVSRLINGPLQGTGDDAVHYVDNVVGGSSANSTLSRKRSAGTEVAPRHRTLSESVHAYLGGRCATENKDGALKRDDEARVPALLLRLTDPDEPV